MEWLEEVGLRLERSWSAKNMACKKNNTENTRIRNREKFYLITMAPRYNEDPVITNNI